MDTGQIQLGVKRSSGKFLDRYPSQGFFYGGGIAKYSWLLDVIASGHGFLARQHLILQIIYWQRATSGCGDDTLMPRMVVSLCSLPV